MNKTKDPNSSLTAYHRKRDFSKTPEPVGNEQHIAHNIFVVQKHAASHLHYDFRLRLHGALKSWAMPKGPSLDPDSPRLAQHVEDHPLEYAGFEGIIPSGQYGAGTVMIWDSGEWEPLGQGKQGFYHGRLDFNLNGHKLKGRWLLIRDEKDAKSWRLVKQPDEYATVDDVLDDISVVSGRTLDQIGQAHDRLWTKEKGLVQPEEPLGFGHELGMFLPKSMVPMAATLVDTVPEGDEWCHEIKYDGYRILCRIDHNALKFFTRKGHDFTDRLKHLRQTVEHIPITRGWLDGEIVVLTTDGKSDFHALQNAFDQARTETIQYLVFDLISYEGYDITKAPLSERKALLADLVPREGPVRYVDHVIGQGQEFYRQACNMRLEGIISKRLDSEYVNFRSRDWLKIKCHHRQEFVVGGYTESGAGRLFGSLLAGYHKEGKLIFAGKIKTGYSTKSSETLIQILRQYEQPDPPFINPPSGVEYRNPHWLKPKLVAEVEFTEISGTGMLRHASFKGLREDKEGTEVVLEEPKRVTATKQKKQPYVFPHERLTRQDIVSYYESVADRMLPYISDRILTLITCRANIFACKFTKHATNLPGKVKKVSVPGHAEPYIAIDSKQALLDLIDYGAIEIHGWQSRLPDLEKPDRMVFDLDPPETGELPWERLTEAALLLRIKLQDEGLESFLQATGGKGYYVVVPLMPEQPWQAATPFAKRIAVEMADAYPDRFTTNLEKEKRGLRIFIDWLRNGRGSNSAEPYSLRVRPGATVSVPIAWEELAEVKPGHFNIRSLAERMAALKRDPWQEYFAIAQAVRG